MIATNLSSIFSGCEALTSIPWNDFNINTSQCEYMDSMFNSCSALTSLDLSNFDTSQVINMSSMFYECEALTSLNLSNFNTSNMQYMSSSFNSCRSLITLNLSNFDTSKVINMNFMFSNCYALKEIICPNGFDMNSCTSVILMLYQCRAYNGEPLHFKNVPRNLDFSDIGGTEGKHYVIDSYKD